MDRDHEFDLVVTLTPDYMDRDILSEFVSSGVSIFRLNGSFLRAAGVRDMVSKIRTHCNNGAKILLDLPGFKPRFSYLEDATPYEAGIPFSIRLKCINYPDIITHMAPGDSVRINDGRVLLRIESIGEDHVTFIPNRSGFLKRGKGFHLEKRGYRPASNCLSELDLELIGLAMEIGIDYVGISFVHDLADIEHVKTCLEGSRTGFIPKIEARESLEWENLLHILMECPTVIVDRGDMAGETGLESVWHNQRKIMDLAKLLDCRVIMATQFFTNMIQSPLPSIAETDSFFDLLKFGIQGIQLSEETCVGNHGFEVIRFVNRSVEYMKGNANHFSNNKGNVVWILGPTASGKTTIAKNLAERLKRSQIPVLTLDGDEIRSLFGPNLSFAPNDRMKVVSTIVHHVKKAVQLGQNVIVSALTAHEEARAFVRENIANVTIVYLDCPIGICAERDKRGLYESAFKGEIETLIGVNTAYEPPKQYDIKINTNEISPGGCVNKLLRYLLLEKRIQSWGVF